MDYIDEYIKDQEIQLSSASLKTYKSELIRFSLWLENSNDDKLFTPEEITPIDLNKYIKEISQTRKSATINKVLFALRSFCKWAIKRGFIEENPAKYLKALIVMKGDKKWLDKHEQYKLIRNAEKDSIRNQALIKIQINAGLRVHEVSNLMLVDIELSDRKGSIFVRGKGQKDRIVPVNKDLRNVLKAYLENRQSNSEYFFPGVRAKKLSTRTVQYVVEEIGYKAKLEDLSCHRLRHTFGKNLIDEGIPLDRVAILMGHLTKAGEPNIKTTMIYTTPSREDLQNAVERISYY